MAFYSFLSARQGPAKAKASSFEDVARFRSLVMAAVKKQLGGYGVVADPADPAKFKTIKGKWSLTSDVTNLFGYLKAYPEEDLEMAVHRFVDSIAEAETRSVDESNIVAVVRHQDYLNTPPGAGSRFLHEPLGADLVVVYMVDRPDSMSPVRLTDFPGKDLANIRKIALDNVRGWLPKLISDDELGAGILYNVEGNELLSPSLILVDEFWKSIAARFPGDVLIALPRRDQLFIFDDDGNPAAQAAVRRLIAGTFEDGFNLLSSNLYARRDGKILLVPE